MKGVIMNITIAEKNEIVAGVIKEMVNNKEFRNSLSKIINSAINDRLGDYVTGEFVDERIDDAIDELVIGRR